MPQCKQLTTDWLSLLTYEISLYRQVSLVPNQPTVQPLQSTIEFLNIGWLNRQYKANSVILLSLGILMDIRYDQPCYTRVSIHKTTMIQSTLSQNWPAAGIGRVAWHRILSFSLWQIMLLSSTVSEGVALLASYKTSCHTVDAATNSTGTAKEGFIVK
jgi:hypothetical protein